MREIPQGLSLHIDAMWLLGIYLVYIVSEFFE